MLFTEFNTNYSKLPAIYRKGSVLLREYILKSLDKDHIIPTLPETLPGSTAADALVAESTMDTEEDTATISMSETPSSDNKRPLELDGATDRDDSSIEGAGENSGALQAASGFKRMKKGVVIDHIDIIGPKFWSGRGAYILAPEKRKKTGPC